jgi:hypothetical protein
MQSNTGYDDSHLARQAFKKKDAPVRETMAKKVPIQSKVDSKIGGKVILNDQLSMSNKSKTATNISDPGAISGIPPMKEASELSDLLRTSGHSDKFSTISKKSRIPATDLNHSQSHTSSKHAVSEAETGARTSQAPSQESGQKGHPIKDFLLESGESLKESLGLCEEVFEYVYQDDTGNLDVDSFKKVSKLHKQMDLIMAESLTDEEIDQGLSNHLESLENIRIMIEKREKERAEMDKLASEFMTKNREVADLPKDFDEVLERVSDQVLEERRSRLAEEPEGFNREVDDLGESDMMKVVKDKLMSTFYGFAKQPSTQETIKETLDDAYLKGLERIRELDKQLALREKEEKAIKDMIKLNKKKERELNMQARLNTPSDLENNPSGLTAQSSKSDFFPTQPKKIAKKTSQNAEARTAEATGSKSIVMPGKRPSKLPSRPASHQSQIEALDQGSSQITVDFIKKNIEESYLSEHERFLRSLKPEGRLRYDCLIKEIEEGLDSDDPMEFRRVSQLHYENAYGYPPELQEKFREIDERIVDMLATEENPQEPKPKTKDVIRERVEKKEAKKRLKQIDERVENIRNGEIQLTPEQLREAINHEIAIIDPEIIQSIKNTIDLAYARLTVETSMTGRSWMKKPSS